MRRMYSKDRLWAGLLSTSGPQGGVIRVPDLFAGIDWWHSTAGFQVRARGRFGDLDVALGGTRSGTTLLIVGGPGALECPSCELDDRILDAAAMTVIDPWGNVAAIAVTTAHHGAAA